MIDLSRTRQVLNEVADLIEELDGASLDERDAITSQSKGQMRQIRAQRSQELQLLAHRLEFAASLVRNEYWFARGESDPLDPDREDDDVVPGD